LSLLLFAALQGAAHGGTIVDDAVLAKHCFGPRFLGRIIGILTAFGTLGFAAGPPLMGYLYDTQGSYRTAFLLLIAMSIAAGLSLFLTSPRSQEDVDRVGARVEERKPDAAVVLE
jgi:MFS family permease